MTKNSDQTFTKKAGNDKPSTGQTQRAAKRTQEDKEFIPVIVKRTDEAVRHPDDILEKAINEGLEQIERPPLSLVLSSMAAGLILSFTAMAVAVIATYVVRFEDPIIFRFATALVYPLGFIVCIMSGSQLFTEHTAKAVYPVLEGKAQIKKLLRLWLLVIVGNMIGAAISAGLLTLTDEVIHGEKGYILIAQHLIGYGTMPLLFSSTLAGWMMALGGWLILAVPAGLSQIICIYIVTFLIGLGGLHHSIAGSVEMFTALLMSSDFAATEASRFIFTAMAGNLIGGSVFVATLNYGHIRKTQEIKS